MFTLPEKRTGLGILCENLPRYGVVVVVAAIIIETENPAGTEKAGAVG